MKNCWRKDFQLWRPSQRDLEGQKDERFLDENQARS